MIEQVKPEATKVANFPKWMKSPNNGCIIFMESPTVGVVHVKTEDSVSVGTRLCDLSINKFEDYNEPVTTQNVLE